MKRKASKANSRKKAKQSPSTRPSKKATTKKNVAAQPRPAAKTFEQAAVQAEPHDQNWDAWSPATMDAGSARPRSQIVGIGASAGGLQALEEFFTHVPANSGMSFVVVTHQDPNRETMLPELMSRVASMPVTLAEEGMVLKSDHIYIAPSGRLLAMRDTSFHFTQAYVDDGHHPIDGFFRSLAENHRENATCVVLSGTGTDGTAGLKIIKAEGGLTMVQDPKTAKFAGMPRSALSTDLVDYVLPPSKFGDVLLKHATARFEAESEDRFRRALRKILILIRGKTGQDFSGYKPSTICRRIERRMAMQHLNDPDRYARFMEENPAEVEALFRELLITVTTFFRDPDAFAILSEPHLPHLLQNKPDDYTFRAWVPGCATGEEAYTIAILVRECMERMKRHLNVQIFATDLDPQAIETARRGLYPVSIAGDITPERLARYFTRENKSYQVVKEIRKDVIFAVHNLITDPPFMRLDFISCRNLLIYLNSTVQKQLFPMFHSALKLDGILMLGTSESVGDYTNLFKLLDRKWKLYNRTSTPATLPEHFHTQLGRYVQRPAHQPAPSTPKSVWASMPKAIEQHLLQTFAPAAILVDEQGEILHIHGHTGKFLEPARGLATLNVFKMAREGLGLELSAALRKARRHKKPVVVNNVRVRSNGGFTRCRLVVSRAPDERSLEGLYLVVFEAMNKADSEIKRQTKEIPHSVKRTAELERELAQAREALQSSVDEAQTVNEELRSTNEELQSTNEELQSTNEELETSKEEMHSLNEELQTVNSELNAKLEELTRANDDLNNLLNSTHIATIFVDSEMRVQRFTPQARKMINLIETDVGRPLSDLTMNVPWEALQADAREVLRTLVTHENEIQTNDGRWYRLRIMPYRTAANVIAGLVITFVDINEGKKNEEFYRELGTAFSQIIREPFLVLRGDLRVVRANQAFYEFFKVEPRETEGELVYDLGNGQWDIPELRELLENILPHHTILKDYEVKREFPGIGRRSMLLNGLRLRREGNADLIFLSIQDVTVRGQ